MTSPDASTVDGSRKCDCHLPTDLPEGIDWWQPILDDEPGAHVKAVVRIGEDPDLRRAVRLENGSGWAEEGAMVNYYKEISPPMPWARVGTCWANSPHPVVAVRQIDGVWVADS